MEILNSCKTALSIFNKTQQTQNWNDLKFIRGKKLLKDVTTWGIGGPCNYFLQVSNQTQLVSAIRFSSLPLLSSSLLSIKFSDSVSNIAGTVNTTPFDMLSLVGAQTVSLMIWGSMVVSSWTVSSSWRVKDLEFTGLEVVFGLINWGSIAPVRVSLALSLLLEFLALLVVPLTWMLEPMARFFSVVPFVPKFSSAYVLIQCTKIL